MVTEITVSESIDSSPDLQALIDSTGNIPAKFVFPEDKHEIEISSRLRFYNNVEWDGKNCTFRLKENVSTDIFGEQIPLLGPKYPYWTEGLYFHDLIFEGNRDKQSKVPKKNGKNWGLGYHNCFTLGDIHKVSYTNSLNCVFENIEFNNGLGDGVRVEGGTGIAVRKIKGKRGGHDIICYAGVLGGEISEVIADLAVNAGVRTRSSSNIKIHDCDLSGDTGIAYSPGIQIQDTNDWDSSGLEIYNNIIRKTMGPGIQVVGDNATNGEVYIHHNILDGCGTIPAANDLPSVGAIIYDGFPVKIQNNTIVDSKGYGIAAGDFNLRSALSYKAEVSRNIVVGTDESNTKGSGSGSAIANLLGSRYAINCFENCLWDNENDLYKVSQSAGMHEDPLFNDIREYRLQENSPCRLSGYELGRWDGTEGTEEEKRKLIVSCLESESIEIIKALSGSYEIYRRK